MVGKPQKEEEKEDPNLDLETVLEKEGIEDEFYIDQVKA